MTTTATRSIPTTVRRPELSSDVLIEPITLAEAKQHLSIANGDTAHDTYVSSLIAAARQQWEQDTQAYLMQRTMVWKLPGLRELQFPHRPVTSIDSITYYDGANSQQTLATSLYDLDTANNAIRRTYLAVWPVTLGRWDAVQITYTLGRYTLVSEVDAISKQAMLLLIGYWFEQRGDMDRPNDMAAYERLVQRHMRSSYP